MLSHLTSSVFFESILHQGLLPDPEKKLAKDDDTLSDPNSVYLTGKYDRFYFKRAVEHYGGKGLVVLVQVPISSLEADEASLNDKQRTCWWRIPQAP